MPKPKDKKDLDKRRNGVGVTDWDAEETRPGRPTIPIVPMPPPLKDEDDDEN